MNTTSHLFRFLVGIDQAFNPLIYGGSENVTISSQSAYNELILHKSHRKRVAIDWLFAKLFDQPDHCYHSLLTELNEFDNADLIRSMLAEKGLHEKS
jgi:hypothetical protein